MFQAIYTSLAKRELGLSEMFGLVEQASANNRKANITGLLLFHQGDILQILEGDEKVIRDLLQKIKIDPRHSDFTIMLERTRDHRSYPDWSMQFKPIETADEVAYFELMLRELKNASPHKDQIKLRSLS